MTRSAAPLPRAHTIAVLIGAATMLSLSMGMRQSLGLFMPPMVRDLQLSAADFTLALAVQNAVWGITQPMIGPWVDRYGVRWIALTGGAIYAVSLALMIWGGSLLTLILGAGVGIGIALSFTAFATTLSAATRSVSPPRRGLAVGIVAAAGSLGTLICAPFAQTMMQAFDWQMALLGFLALAIAILPAAFATGIADRVPVAAPTDRALSLREALIEAGGHRGYVVMTVAFFVCGLQLVFITTHLPTYLANCGIDPMVGAQALALIGAFNVVGSFLFGWLSDRYSKRLLLAIIYLARTAVFGLYFALPATPLSTLLFAAAMGLTWLGVVPLVNGLIAQIFGLRFMATLYGITFFSHQLGSFVGAWGGGLLYDWGGSYDLAWKIGVVIGLIAGTMQLLMDERPTARMAAQPA
ncbi:MAG: MFS transporter [Alphaproteobacteria bacterium]|nr:MFS transporter [Alphaproteobacteria bacterium]MCW5742737.1 MFS transporter [Alphaproteobacteria bacterium]